MSQQLIGRLGPSGPTGLQGVTGAAGVQGPTGLVTQGATGVGERYSSVSTTSLTLGTGIQTMTIGLGLGYTPQQDVIIVDPVNEYHMHAKVLSYNSGTGSMQFDAYDYEGSGTFSSWTVNLSGLAGGPGETGVQGPTGFQGVTGVAGVNGAAGATGVAGETGVQGTQGATGIQGLTGVQGATGVAGATGVGGATGVQGIDGATGVQGAQGIKGATGVQGVQGNTGVQGTTGVAGATGVQGIQGLTGVQGTTGIQGQTGPLGTTGVGSQGATGPGATPTDAAVSENMRDIPSQNYTSNLLEVISTGVYSYQSQTQVLAGTSTTIYTQYIRGEVIDNARHIQPGLALDDLNNNAWAWGKGTADNTGNIAISPVSVVGARRFDTVIKNVNTSTGDEKVLAIDESGFAWAWGANVNGELGINVASSGASSPVSVVGGNVFVTGDVGTDHKVALDFLGYAWAWGAGTSGGLGNNTVTTSSSPVSVVGARLLVQVDAATNSSSAIDINNYAWCWGLNSSGQVGDNSATNRSSPVSVVGGYTFYQVRGGNAHRIAQNFSNRLFSWGLNSSGQLGDATTINRSSPVSVVGNYRYVDIATGDNHSLGLDKFGVIWTWGSNSVGQLGDGTTVPRSSPASINAGLVRFVMIGACGDSSAAVDTKGNAWCWGDNTVGLLGDGTSDNRSSPAAVANQPILFKTRKVY